MRNLGKTLILAALVLACSQAHASLPSSEMVSGGRSRNSRGATNEKSSNECTTPICLPKNVVDDDPTMGGKLPDCDSLGSVLGTVNNSEDQAEEAKRKTNVENGGVCFAPQGGLNAAETEKTKVAKLYKCLEQVRGLMPGDLDAQKKFVTELKSARLKTYLGMIMTAYGETTGDMKTGDQLAVMKVIDNSTRSCVNKKSKDVTAWEAAIAPARFSMYNKGTYGKNKDTFLKDKEKDTDRMKSSIEAFTKLQCAKFEPPKEWEEAMHYKADYVSPSWAKAKDLVQSPNVNNTPLKTSKPMHQFYKLEWNCAIEATNRTIKSSTAVASSLNPTLQFLLGEPAFALSTFGDWELVQFKGRGNFLRMKSHPLIQLEVAADPNGARITKVEPLKQNKKILVISYDAGEFGTSQILQVEKAALYDTRARKFLGNFALSYSENGAKIEDQPLWTASLNELRVYDPMSGSTDLIEFQN
jgi:hypothetical protein